MSRTLHPQRSLPFTVISIFAHIEFKSVYFLLVRNCYLRCMSYGFRDTAARIRELLHPSLNPWTKGIPSYFVVKLAIQKVEELGYVLVETERDTSLSRFVTIQQRYRRRLSDRRHDMTIAERCKSVKLESAFVVIKTLQRGF